MTLKEIRKYKGLTQSECASYLGISLRSYKSYENDLDNIPHLTTERRMKKNSH